MAELVHEFRLHNADTSYQPIVGGGDNTCILHYRENDQTLRDGDLLLVDAGCEYQCYASDITRTYPVNGRFTPEQRAVYEVVLEANLAAIAKVKPGNHWNDPHDAAVRVVTQGLVKLGLLKGRRRRRWRRTRRYKQVLHAPHRPLARHGRARRRRLQGRRRVARARARHGDDHRARHLHRRRARAACRSASAASASASRTTWWSRAPAPKCSRRSAPEGSGRDRSADGGMA